MRKIFILIPIYNDWESVSKLIKEINFCIKDLEAEFSIIVINDASNNQKTTFMVTNDEFASITVYSDQPYIQSSGTCSPFFSREYIFFKG